MNLLGRSAPLRCAEVAFRRAGGSLSQHLDWLHSRLGAASRKFRRSETARASSTHGCSGHRRSSPTPTTGRSSRCSSSGLSPTRAGLQKLVDDYGLSIYATEARMLRAWLEARRERDPRHVDRLEAALARRAAMGTAFVQTCFRYLVADAWLFLGRPERARGLIDHALLDAESTGEKSWFAELLWMRARIGLAIGDRDTDKTGQDLRAAIADARSRNALMWELRAASDLSTLLLDRRCRREEAADTLRPIISRFTKARRQATWCTRRRYSPVARRRARRGRLVTISSV